MNALSPCEQELVALGAALGSNCIPCIEYHIPEARKAGLTDAQIADAIRLADTLRQVPARKVLNAAARVLRETPAASDTDDTGSVSGHPAQANCCTGGACCA
ncbi:MAG TPA: carboxymuconolactone decarboxylase family protein [archaeon]|nr:carboxymuconolactone decarboxylase family protein [archaeon]